MVQEWIRRHKKDLLELWDIAKRGRDYRPVSVRTLDLTGFC